MKLLTVCLGNICRSPMAEGALRARLDAAGLDWVETDSSGTGGWHAGEAPDRRAIACARGHGVDIGGLRARKLKASDFIHFDWLLCADAQNLQDAYRIAPAGLAGKAVLLLDWAGLEPDGEVADPYYGDAGDFERTWAQVDAAAKCIVARIASGAGVRHPA